MLNELSGVTVTLVHYLLNKFQSCKSGATAIEYTLIAAGISLGIAAAVFLFGDDLAVLYAGMSTAFTN